LAEIIKEGKYLRETTFLMAEWDWEKNLNVDPYIITRGTAKKVWWKCSLCGNSWLASPHNRKRKYCGVCNRKIARKHRISKNIQEKGSLEFLYPELVSEWDIERNQKSGLFPSVMTIKSNEKAYWICRTCDYHWKASIAHRTGENTGCPCCSGKVVVKGLNDLETKHPNLASEWLYSKNDFLPCEVTAGSGKNVWWKCSICEHEWLSSINNRVKGNNCPRCQGKNTSFVEQCIYFYLLQAFEDVKNRYIEPLTKKEIDIYVISLNFGIEYDGFRYHNSAEKSYLDDQKTKALQNIGIPILRIRETNRQKNFISLPKLDIKPYAEIEYHPDGRTESVNCLILEILRIISRYSGYCCNIPEIDCLKDRFSILHLMYQGRFRNSLSELNPEVAEFWDSERNYPLKPNEVTPCSNMKVFWLCPICGYKWEAGINSQRKSKGCPKCNKSVVSEEYNFAFLYPHLLSEWYYEENIGVDPKNIMPFSHEHRSWKCDNCGNIWKASTAHRINNTNCPKCGREKADNSRKKPVIQIDRITNDKIAIYESAREAERTTGIKYKSISACCTGTKKSAGVYFWEFGRNEV